MPILQIFTNVATKSIPPKFPKCATEFIASLTGKREGSAMVVYIILLFFIFTIFLKVLVNAGLFGCFGGSNDPFIFAELQSIGGFTEPNKVTGKMTKLFTEHFGVSGDRIYMKLTNLEANQISCDGKLKGSK